MNRKPRHPRIKAVLPPLRRHGPRVAKYLLNLILPPAITTAAASVTSRLIS